MMRRKRWSVLPRACHAARTNGQVTGSCGPDIRTGGAAMSSSEAAASHPTVPTPAATEAAAAHPARRARALLFGVTLTAILLLLFGVPWWTLFAAGTRWPAAVVAAGSAVFVAGLVGFPVLMVLGHGRRHRDRAAAGGDTILGVIWVLFSWAVLGNLARLALALGGLGEPARSRWVAGATLAVTVVLV